MKAPDITTEPRLNTIEDVRTVLAAAGFASQTAEGAPGEIWAKNGTTVFVPRVARGVVIDKVRRAVKKALAEPEEAGVVPPAPAPRDWTPIDLFDFSKAETCTWAEIEALMAAGTMCQRLVKINKELAGKIIQDFNTHNRDLAGSTVSKYASDMREGRWGVSHQGIGFDSTRRMIDGQHRLFAIDDADAEIWVWVAVNLPAGSQDFIDQGKPRKALDVARLSGDASATSFQMALARAMYVGNRTQVVVSRQEHLAFFRHHREAIVFVTDVCFQKRRAFYVVQAPVGAVMARASYLSDREKLKRFGEVMLEGVTHGESERPIILLREWLRNGAPREASAQRVAKPLVIYMKSERALLAYLQEESIRTIYALKEEAFPLPEEAAPRRSRTKAQVGPGRPVAAK